MYWQVYLHPDAKSYEIMIQQFFKRYAQVRNIEVFEPLLNGELSKKDIYLMKQKLSHLKILITRFHLVMDTE